MTSEIDSRTRQDPQAALLNQPDAPNHQLVNPDPSAKGEQGFDTEAHRAFMRGLG